MIVYVDTSFLFSLYVPDSNSAAATAKIKKLKPPLVLSDFGEFEFVNAVAWRVFRKDISTAQQGAVLALFLNDVHAGTIRVLPTPSSVFEKSRQIAQKYTPIWGSRALDILHVASAVSLQAKTFCTFDVRQAALARTLKLTVI